MWLIRMCLRWWGISFGNEVPVLSGAGYPARGVVVVMVRRRALKKCSTLTSRLQKGVVLGFPPEEIRTLSLSSKRKIERMPDVSVRFVYQKT